MSVAAGAETIGARLAATASRFPEKMALVEGSSAVTFRQLDAAATAIAQAIQAVRQSLPGRVCLFFEDKVPAIKAIFGAGRSGCAYIPVDAGDPEERLRSIVLDSAPAALLTEHSLLDRARAIAPSGCTIIDIVCLQPAEAASPQPEVSPDAPVYLYYTSGSTGRPKGAIQTHRNLLFFANAYARALAIGEHDRLSLLYTLSFNAANMDIFGGLLSGATLCAYDMRRDGIIALADWLDRERISVLHCVPTVFRELGNRLSPGRLLPHLRAIDLGGEAVFASDIDLFRAHTQERCVFVNQLAATEVGLIGQHVVEHGSPRTSDSVVPVGRCPEGVRVEIRRDNGNAADAGDAGEIVVCSPYVSPGYWRRPELDAVAFAADPRDPGSRLYFTGDLGRIDEHGVLHFLGRRGSRVKIRGHTVDLAEVEAGLVACAGVTKAAVLAVGGEGPTEPGRLVAYLVVGREAERNATLIRRRLARLLPSYMLPNGYVFLDALPLTASGKIDRRALGAIAPPEANGEREIEPPRDDLERSIAGIFEQMLKLAPIGRDDDFFLLGGDSLSAVELQLRLRDTFCAALANPIEGATVAGIAAEIRRQRAATPGAVQSIPRLIPLRRHGSKPPLFLVHGRLGQALVSPHFLDLLGGNQPVWGFQAMGLDSLRSPQPTIEAMAGEYLAEMRRERPRGPYFLGGLCAGAFVAIIMARRLRAEGECVLPLLLLDPPERPFPVREEELTDERLLARLKRRQEAGRINASIDDPAHAQAAVRASRAFEHAIRAHEVQPYEGPVCILSSHERMAGIDSSRLKKIFRGRVERFEVGRTHPEMLDPHNRAFAVALERCLSVIHEYADDPRLPHLARADSPNAIP
jgi:amino acid adenylation domain-containing protein